MRILFISLVISLCCIVSFGQDSLTLRDLTWDAALLAGTVELNIPSSGSLLQGFLYRANGKQKHPTLLLLHGYPGNERNLDLAQVVRSNGWNVIYFDYRGSWGSQGKFSFENAVEDVANVVEFCIKHKDEYQIDTSNIALFGHSMGGWVGLKAIQRLPTVKKGFFLSTWNIYGGVKNVKNEQELSAMVTDPKAGVNYFVLNTPVVDIFKPVLAKPDYFNLVNDAKPLADKQIVMLDEHPDNKPIADSIRGANRAYFDYQTWPTDHGFTNKRVSLMNMVLKFLAR